MKKMIMILSAFTLAGSLYAGSGCGSSCGKKSADKSEDKAEKEVVVQGSETKECDTKEKTCGNKSEA